MLGAVLAGGLAQGFYDLAGAGPTRLLVRTQQLEAAGSSHSLKGKYGEVKHFLAQKPAVSTK